METESFSLKRFTVRLDDLDEMHHVAVGERRVLKNQAEEVRLSLKRLVSDHHRTFLHHTLLDLRRHFVQLLFEVLVACRISQLFRDVPEANVGALRF